MGPVPTNVASAAIAVCRDALHWRGDLRAIFIAAGVPSALYDRYDLPGVSKAKIARLILDELRERGPAGHAIQRKIVEELCRMTKPHRDAPDQAAGAIALGDLKREATAEQILVDPERATVEARKATAQRRQRVIDDQRARLGELRTGFLALLTQPVDTLQQRQARGYDLEKLLARLFRVHDMDYRPSYRVGGEQIDGSFYFRGFTYLVESRWRCLPPSLGDLLDFKGKVDGKFDSTRGAFISMAGFDTETIDNFVRNSRGSRNNILLFTGADITRLFDGTFGLVDALTKKVDAAEQEGKPLCNL
jgi:hypothetical protein